MNEEPNQEQPMLEPTGNPGSPGSVFPIDAPKLDGVEESAAQVDFMPALDQVGAAPQLVQELVAVAPNIEPRPRVMELFERLLVEEPPQYQYKAYPEKTWSFVFSNYKQIRIEDIVMILRRILIIGFARGPSLDLFVMMLTAITWPSNFLTVLLVVSDCIFLMLLGGSAFFSSIRKLTTPPGIEIDLDLANCSCNSKPYIRLNQPFLLACIQALFSLGIWSLFNDQSRDLPSEHEKLNLSSIGYWTALSVLGVNYYWFTQLKEWALLHLAEPKIKSHSHWLLVYVPLLLSLMILVYFNDTAQSPWAYVLAKFVYVLLIDYRREKLLADESTSSSEIIATSRFFKICKDPLSIQSSVWKKKLAEDIDYIVLCAYLLIILESELRLYHTKKSSAAEIETSLPSSVDPRNHFYDVGAIFVLIFGLRNMTNKMCSLTEQLSDFMIIMRDCQAVQTLLWNSVPLWMLPNFLLQVFTLAFQEQLIGWFVCPNTVGTRMSDNNRLMSEGNTPSLITAVGSALDQPVKYHSGSLLFRMVILIFPFSTLNLMLKKHFLLKFSEMYMFKTSCVIYLTGLYFALRDLRAGLIQADYILLRYFFGSQLLELFLLACSLKFGPARLQTRGFHPELSYIQVVPVRNEVELV